MFNVTPRTTKRLPVRREDEQHPFNSLQREVNRLFDNFFRGQDAWEDFGQFPMIGRFDQSPTTGPVQWFGEVMPRVDMSETDKELVVKVDLPGMTEKDVTVSLNRDTLTISGEKKQEKEQNEKGWYRMEREYGSFTRTVALPYEIQSDKVEALYKNGVLTIKLPKSAEDQRSAKSIPVKPA